MNVTLLQVTLTTLSPVSVTTPEIHDFRTVTGVGGVAQDSVDMPLRRDASGAPTIPATTVAGSIRAHLPDALREPLMGRAGDDPTPSPLYVLAVAVTPPTQGEGTEVRRRTAIDRHRAAPAARKLFDIEALAAGTTLTVSMELHGPPSMRDELLAALASWHPRVGRGVSTGAGRTELQSLTYATVDLVDDDALLAYLNGVGPDFITQTLARAGQPATIEPRASTLEFNVDLRIMDALHVGSGDARGNLLLMLRDTQGSPVVPGSSLKGVLRSRCEHILRSIGVAACLDAACGTCPTCDLFGFTLATPDEDGRTGQRGLVAFRDAPVTQATEAQRPHVAIDRVSGGARDSALYAVECVDGGVVTIKIERLAPLPPWAEGLIGAALLDIADGYVGVGGATTRGYGTLARRQGDVFDRATATAALQQVRRDYGLEVDA